MVSLFSICFIRTVSCLVTPKADDVALSSSFIALYRQRRDQSRLLVIFEYLQREFCLGLDFARLLVALLEIQIIAKGLRRVLEENALVCSK